jgi:UDPglucose 6-dehydrogenase
MSICVFGLWHLGSVTAACVAEKYPTVGLDPDPATVSGLQTGKPPILEPELGELLRTGISKGALRFTTDIQEAVAGADVVWVAFDTPVDESDSADFGYVEEQIISLFPHLRDGTVVLISSQMPVGSTTRIEKKYRACHLGKSVRFAYSPENLRLGKAIDVFRNPGRIIVGVRNQGDQEVLGRLLTPFCQNLIWMSVESAEMTKHALNAFLANSITFMNEVATVCEEVGADAKEVELGLKSDARIGPRAYLSPGGAFAGGTLARDVSFLTMRASQIGIEVPLLASIRQSNEFHKAWPRRKLESLLGGLTGKTVSLLGLTYKPGTDTLRRSAAVELATWLSSRGAVIRAFDPAVKRLPDTLDLTLTLCESAMEALKDAEAAVVATEWPQFRELKGAELIATMKTPIVLDANRFLEKSLGISPPLLYIAVGKPKEAT